MLVPSGPRRARRAHQRVVLAGKGDNHYVVVASALLGRQIRLGDGVTREARATRVDLLAQKEAHLRHVVARVHCRELVEHLIVVLLGKDVSHPFGEARDVEERWRAGRERCLDLTRHVFRAWRAVPREEVREGSEYFRREPLSPSLTQRGSPKDKFDSLTSLIVMRNFSGK